MIEAFNTIAAIEEKPVTTLNDCQQIKKAVVCAGADFIATPVQATAGNQKLH